MQSSTTARSPRRRAGGGYLDVFANAFTNNGAITVGNGESMLAVGTCAFSNAGSITVTGGGMMNIADSLAQLSGGTLTGGSFEVDAGSTLMLPEDSTITADNATLILSGAGSTMESFSSTTWQDMTVDSSLASVGTGGTLELLQGRSFAVTGNGGSFTDSGVLQLGGGNFLRRRAHHRARARRSPATAPCRRRSPMAAPSSRAAARSCLAVRSPAARW